MKDRSALVLPVSVVLSQRKPMLRAYEAPCLTCIGCLPVCLGKAFTEVHFIRHPDSEFQVETVA